MPRHDKLVAFLEREAAFLRTRIADLREREFPPGVTTGDSQSSPLTRSRLEAEAKLKEIEEHIDALRRGDEAR